METSVGTANCGDGVLVGNGEGVGQASASIGDGFAFGNLDLFSIEDTANGGGIGRGSGNDKGREIQTDLANVFGTFADTGSTTSSLGSGSGVFEIGAIFSHGRTAS